MDIRHLKYFDSLVRNKSFTKASEELHISQPSLSNQIKTLEQELDFKLFERSTKNVNLTESGQVFYKYVIRVLKEFNNLYKEMNNIKDVGTGVLNIGMVDSVKYWIPQVIAHI